jgi:hypothetical protein
MVITLNNSVLFSLLMLLFGVEISVKIFYDALQLLTQCKLSHNIKTVAAMRKTCKFIRDSLR